MNVPTTRREVLTTLLASAAATAIPAELEIPRIHTRRRGLPSNQSEVITGEGEYRYRVNHNFCQLPQKYSWQTTHNVAIDAAQNLYVIHEGKRDLKDHPAIFVFDPDGKFLRAFGCQFQGGGHGIDIRKEGSEEFIYVAAYQQVKAFAKLTLTGETVWHQKAPMKSGVYARGEDTSTEPTWTREGFLPTNFAFLDDGGFLLADGYGAYCIHRFDAQADWQSQFGGAGEGKGKFNTAHGLCIDRRTGQEPGIIVTDRAHNTLQFFSLDGEYRSTLSELGWPANVETYGRLLLVPELHARVSLFDEQNQVVARLGAAVERLQSIKDLRNKPAEWKDGEFIHPHDACFDQSGNIFVAEWVATGRVTKLSRIN